MRYHRSMIAAIVIATASMSTAYGQQEIEQIDGSSALVGARGVAVPPVKRSEVRALVDLGTVETDGYERIVMNLAGQMLSVDEAGGTVGVILIPDVEPFGQAFSGYGLLPASIEITVNVNSRTAPYFMASQEKVDVAFPRYRAFAYNNTRSAVSISFFAYRSR
jgi:hypothetical protein